MNVLAIDQGTSATKALVVSGTGEVLGSAERPVSPDARAGGAVEQDPEELLSSVLEAGRAALEASGATVGAIGLANQGETVLAWDPATGRPLTTAISWQDRRAIGVAERLAPHGARLTELTGLPLDPYFSAPKMTWLREELTTGGIVTTTDSWLVRQLAGVTVTDATTASRSLLLDLDRREWSEEACELFGLDLASLPEVVDCAGVVGESTAFGSMLPITGLAVDQQAALVGERCLQPGEAKCTFGTGAFLLVTAGSLPRRSSHGLSASVAWQVPGSVGYCLDGQSYTAGAAIGWLTRMGVLDAPEHLDAVASSVPDAGGLVLVPALAGLGAPWWRPAATGTIEGLGLHTEPAHLVRAMLEGLAAQVALLARAAADDLGRPLTTLRVDGGLTRSAVLMQHQADLLRIPVEVFSSPDATALGIAASARLGAGDRDGLDGSPLAPAARFEPIMPADEAAERLARFGGAARRAIEASEEGARG